MKPHISNTKLTLNSDPHYNPNPNPIFSRGSFSECSPSEWWADT